MERDAAELSRVGDALIRLAPALDKFVDAPPPRVPAYQDGTVPSQPLPLPEDGVGLDATIDELAIAVEHGCRVGAPGFVAYITTSATTAGVVAAAANAVAGGQRYLLHAFNALERTGLRWLAELCGVPAGATGVFSSGGSTANLVALGAARQSAFERHGIDVGEQGLPPGRPARIYASVRAHRTIHRAAAVLGLGRGGVAAIPTRDDERIDVVALERALREDTERGVLPIAVVAIAGTTDTGAIDPIADVIEVARRYGAWTHVDGAYGLVAHADPAVAPSFAGVEDADSWIVDPHKWLTTGVGVAATYVRDAGVLTRAFTEGHADYLEGSFDPEGEPPVSQFDEIGGPWSDQGVELSSPPRGVFVWAVLREIGRAGVRDRIRRDNACARTLADLVRDDERLELLCEPELSIVCYRYRPDDQTVDANALNARILQRLRRETPLVPSSTVVRGSFALRPCFINPRTTPDEVTGLATEVRRIGDELVAG